MKDCLKSEFIHSKDFPSSPQRVEIPNKKYPDEYKAWNKSKKFRDLLQNYNIKELSHATSYRLRDGWKRDESDIASK